MSKTAKKNQPSDSNVRKKKKGPAHTDEPGSKRHRGVRIPKLGYSAEEWLTPLYTDEIPVPLKVVEPSAEEMSRRNIPRPTIPTKSAIPTRARRTSDEQNQQGEKRQKPSANALQSRPVNQPPTEKVPSPPKEKGVDVPAGPHIDLTDPEIEAAILRHFSPSYTMPDGRVLLMKDSVKEEPNLAVTLLRGLALPRDYDQVPTDLMPGLGEMCSHLVQARQATLKAYDKAAKVSFECERYRSDRDSFRTKWRISENQADAKGYEAGIQRAALEYTQVAHRMVNDEIEVRLPDFFKLGLESGAKAMAGVMAIEPESGFMKQLPKPVFPPLDLPYSEEECQPLPPEEDEEEAAADPNAVVDEAQEKTAGEKQIEVE
ncbi:hypothetical protein RHSIM_Rhsim05G0059700 [Rhododendron simsii]|uniref:Uncharacterized protein n=1 Tax=Rhododendron simsii TaxID=118357 RepID=A0A834H238_RHOSS|nr:hypothetical protein RHSIM_Rhsim05G0059700 [Rhododendron simsii]